VFDKNVEENASVHIHVTRAGPPATEASPVTTTIGKRRAEEA
jgi:hypothetical protein